MKKRKNDIILLTAVIAAAALVWLVLRVTQTGGAAVVVTVDGEIYGTYPLNEDAEIRIGDDETYNVILIEDGGVRMIDASCPRKLCVKQGEIRYDGQSIICLPNKVVVTIEGGGESEYDAVAK